jgi:phosphoribosylformimino-5-aminoimidazole carboxamide ribotide isomerase
MIEIIPAIDLFQGKCVRLKQGDYEQMTIYSDNPVDLALRFEDAGIRRLHLVDLEGARKRYVIHAGILKEITRKTSLLVDFGGGVRTLEEVNEIFDSGARMITVGSIAATDPDRFQEWMNRYGAKNFILGADTMNNKIAISGWTDVTEINLHEYIEKYARLGVKQILSTDISRDGMLEGIAVDFYSALSSHFPGLDFIASGGVTSLYDIIELDRVGVYGAVVGKAYYDGRITLDELQTWMAGNTGK